MAKINLLTIHWGNSYGGTMQTYATKKILESLNHEVKVINLVHPKFKNELLLALHKSKALFIMTCWFYLFRMKYHFNLTRRMYGINVKYLPKCDYCIVGCDQVWNRDITSNINKSYFLDFDKNVPKVSLASSFGKGCWNEDEEYTLWVRKQLKSFKAISVREDSGVKICQNIFGVNAIQLIDPTIAWGKYDSIIKDKSVFHQVYPFLLVKNSETSLICNKVSEYLNLPLYLPTGVRHFLFQSPKEWLRRMKNSDFIVTDSFHGLAFCLIFHKRFIVLCANVDKFTRLMSLLRLVHLEERYVKDINYLDEHIEILNKRIDYTFVDRIFESEREKYINFIKENIQ